jgi:hypothetical protein
MHSLTAQSFKSRSSYQDADSRRHHRPHGEAHHPASDIMMIMIFVEEVHRARTDHLLWVAAAVHRVTVPDHHVEVLEADAEEEEVVAGMDTVPVRIQGRGAGHRVEVSRDHLTVDRVQEHHRDAHMVDGTHRHEEVEEAGVDVKEEDAVVVAVVVEAVEGVRATVRMEVGVRGIAVRAESAGRGRERWRFFCVYGWFWSVHDG